MLLAIFNIFWVCNLVSKKILLLAAVKIFIVATFAKIFYRGCARTRDPTRGRAGKTTSASVEFKFVSCQNWRRFRHLWCWWVAKSPPPLNSLATIHTHFGNKNVTAHIRRLGITECPSVQVHEPRRWMPPDSSLGNYNLFLVFFRNTNCCILFFRI